MITARSDDEIVFGEIVKTSRRTWRDRLLSWPWRPWISHIATRVVGQPVYDPRKNAVYCRFREKTPER